ncbi:MAG TPA: adenylyltransferase/cytidyltransferase family protein, partial [Candidatus Limnocylindria bacterium]
MGGTFDLFHLGHVNLLRNAKKHADIVVVALNTDEFNEQYKGKRPVMTLAERRAVLEACRYVDVVDVNTGGADS